MPQADRPPTSKIVASIDVTLKPLGPRDQFETEWRDLEQRSDGSFFTSWSWIGCWIDSLAGAVDLQVLRARAHGHTVGLGLFASCRVRRHGVVVSRTLNLHSTGRPEFDVLAIECNGLLVDRKLADAASQAMFDCLAPLRDEWDEIYLDGLWRAPTWQANAGVPFRRREREIANHFVVLEDVRERGGDYLTLLGAKTRARIRRSRREYESIGPLRIAEPTTADEAKDFLEALEVLHQSYWTGRGFPGAFSYAFFRDFHQRLVREAFARGEIQLLAIDAGQRRLGYIYNFVYRGRVYNYQSGFDFQVCERQNRPGLVAHAHAIEYNAKRGHAVYDFLAGDMEYKHSLGTSVASMTWLVLQRGRLVFTLEDIGRATARWLRRQSGDARAPDRPASLR